MFEFFEYAFMRRALLAALLGGITCGLVGVWVVMLGIPFVGVAMAHAAFAGALFGLLLNINPLASAFGFCVISAAFIGPMADKGDFEPNLSTGIIFSIVLGAAFLFMGMLQETRAEAMMFIWGNILTVSTTDIYLLAVTAALVIIFPLLFFKEILSVLYDRFIARAAGIPDRAIFYVMLFLCGLTVTLNLNTVGGILIFSLVIAPPAAAYQLTYSLKTMHFLSAFFGVFACFSGLMLSYAFNLPSGASIITVSGLVFLFCLIFSPKKNIRADARA